MPPVRRVEKKLFRITDELQAVREEEARLAAEVEEHRNRHHEARLDAIDGHADDRAYFKDIESDLARFERALRQVEQRRAGLEEERVRLLAKLG